MRSNEDAFQKAKELLRKHILVDGHIDLTWRLSGKSLLENKKYLDDVIHSEKGDFDFERAKQGYLSAPFMAIYIDARFQDDLSTAKAEADQLINMIHEIIDTYPDKFAKGDSPEVIEA